MYCISISHKTAPLSIRNQLSFTQREIEAFTKTYLDQEQIKGIVLLSTCNRFELYFSARHKTCHQLEEELIHFKGLGEEIRRYLLFYEGESAIRHLHKVASGLDSMVIGEDEILGQLRDAYEKACEMAAADYELHQIFQSSFACAKKIKTKTALSKVSVSVASLTAKKVKECYPKGGVVLVLGITGKTGSTVCKDLLYKTGERYQIIGTTRRHGAFAQKVLKEVRMEDYASRYQYIAQADVVISATASPHYTLTYLELLQALSGTELDKPRLFMDLAVPNDIEKKIGTIPGITLYDMDYFTELANTNNAYKLSQAQEAEHFIEEYVDTLLKELAFHSFLPEFTGLAQQEAGKVLQKQIYAAKANLSYQEFLTVLKAVRLGREALEEEALEGDALGGEK